MIESLIAYIKAQADFKVNKNIKSTVKLDASITSISN